MKTVEDIYTILDEVKDPEIPVLTVNDMGIIRGVSWNKNVLEITITPTYTGCPAMDMIEAQIKEVLTKYELYTYKVLTTLSPPWSTDWISEDGLHKLEEFGIAPPVRGTADKRILFAEPPKPKCPYCKSKETEMVSAFGSTACKSQYKCKECLEPFDYFKCI